MEKNKIKIIILSSIIGTIFLTNAGRYFLIYSTTTGQALDIKNPFSAL